MDFGSKYVYKYNNSSDESLSDEEAVDRDYDDLFMPRPMMQVLPAPGACTMEVASYSPDTGELPPPPPDALGLAIPVPPSQQQNKRRRMRKADTNVLSVRFNQLLQPGEMHAGDAIRCEDCGAIASHLSKILPGTTGDENQSEEILSKWQCEFCPHLNTVDIEQNDLPKHEDATYLITPAPVVHGSDMTGVDDSMVFFLIDTSGSMSSTTLVQGNFEMPNALKQQQRAAEQFGGAHMIRRRNETYVSRLQGVQMAVDVNLDKLVKDTPTRRAALLTFNHEITYYGDGTRDEPLVIRGDKLNSTEDLQREADRELNNELKPVGQTKTKLTEHVYDLEEGGQTALGPAVIFALNIASKRQGSKIVICTDGLANRGLGTLETATDEKAEEAVKLQALEQGNQFYANLTERAREKGVSISVITIKGTACLLPVIGQMADGTGGNVTIVDLLNIRDEFASILEQQVIASNVEAILIVHRGLYIRDPDNPEQKLDKVIRNIGNVTKQTEVTFEFGVKNKEEIQEKYHIDIDQLQQLPFQVQVTYTAADGSKALRVLTQLKETTDNREIAEVNAVRSVIAENHIRSTANDMMASISDDEDDDGQRMRSKWSTPVVQKQRLAYMENLNYKVRSRETHGTDQFNERRWNKASNELQSHVISSRSRKAGSSRSTVPMALPAADASSSSGSYLGAIGDRVARLFTGGTREDESNSKLAVPSTTSRSHTKRSYGFATSNVSHFSDQHSEDLYRYKNISSDYMRETSPTRDEHRPPIAPPRANRPAAKRDDDDDGNRPPVPTRNRRPVANRDDNDEHSAGTMNTGRFEVKGNDDDGGKPTASSNFNRFGARRNSGDDRSAGAAANTDRFATRRNDVGDKSGGASGSDRFARERNEKDDKSGASTSHAAHSSTERKDDADDDNDVVAEQ